MRRLLLLTIFVIPAVTIFLLINGSKQKAQILGPSPAELATEIQSSWAASDSLVSLEDPALNDKIITEIGLLDLSHQQKNKLAQVLDRWFRHLHVGTIESFHGLRMPDSLQFNPTLFKFLISQGRLQQEVLERMVPADKLKVYTDYATRSRFDFIVAKSMRVGIFIRSAAASGVDAAEYYPGGYVLLHPVSPVRYKVGPSEVYSGDKRVQWATFFGAYRIDKQEGNSVPILVVFFWSSANECWRPWECYIGNPFNATHDGLDALIAF